MKTFLCVLFNLLLTSIAVFSQQTFSFSYEEPLGSVNTSQSPIDTKTRQVLTDIGWIAQDDAIKINCSGINETGIASVYNSYTFTASANGGNITNHQWTYRIKKNDGTYETIRTTNTPAFTISPVTISSQYARNSDGNIIGEIGLTGTVNGVNQKTTMTLYLDYAPDEITFSTKIIHKTDWVYDVEFALSSKGAESLSMTTQNWDTGVAWINDFTGYQYIKLVVSNLPYESEMGFIFEATNQYGHKEITYDMPKVYPQMNPFIYDRGVINSLGEKVASFEAYTVDGRYVTQANSKAALNSVLQSDIYIVRSKDAEGNVLQTEKIINK
ncbi:MAG: hypothetical protein LBG15_08760 [Dysgonamonadaceae bacterium]|jgi:hypothetical protein|nr:hypothetical protein [Dysgonamonadaceae bacterium]